ncbi:hypothetical protein KJF94_20995 [Pseudomonas hormoni]|uniref:Uncharacterized protein n=1 Tax=Pseudomonas hormoni TaxID=3093767 RepID=A0ABX8ES14_9PSED|nr:hypothetical protein [Pseudomonas hormoni]QVW22332.1 hypothetical protein KJF94_20995 [Pseudomonas hormoni]
MQLKTRSAINRMVAFGAGLLLWLGAQAVSAATQEITAVFRPDPFNPSVNKFTNTTPQSGVCPWHMPARCEALGIFSIRATGPTFHSTGPMAAGELDERKRVMFKVPSDWRRFEVISERGDRQAVEMRIAGVGNRFDIPNPPGTYAWGGIWGGAPAPCQASGMYAAGPTIRLWFWLVPEGAGACGMASLVDIPQLDYVNFEYSYELRTPNPLRMQTGQYSGFITFTVGPNKDFDFGDIMIPNDETLTFNFSLDVQHTLKVEVPPGGNHVELVPQGGWQAWLNNNRQPARLFRDQTFNISASSRFKMKLECGQEMGDTCSLRNADNHQVPMQISVSLPSGLTRADGSPVNRQPLLLSGSGTELFQPGHYVDRKPGTLHFEVGRDDTKEMLKYGGTQFSGTATVIWDSEA